MGIEVGYFVVSRAFKKEFSSLNHEELLWVYTSRENYSVFYRPECRISSPPFPFPPEARGRGLKRGRDPKRADHDENHHEHIALTARRTPMGRAAGPSPENPPTSGARRPPPPGGGPP